MTKPERESLLRFVAASAAQQMPQMSLSDRARLLDGMALILTGEDARQCRMTAQALRRADDAQLTLVNLFQNP